MSTIGEQPGWENEVAELGYIERTPTFQRLLRLSEAVMSEDFEKQRDFTDEEHFALGQLLGRTPARQRATEMTDELWEIVIEHDEDRRDAYLETLTPVERDWAWTLIEAMEEIRVQQAAESIADELIREHAKARGENPA